MKVYAVYETDQWLSRSSYEMKGIFSSKERAIKYIIDNKEIDPHYVLEDEDEDFDGDFEEFANACIRRELYQNNQTQGYPTNYTIEEINMNEWL